MCKRIVQKKNLMKIGKSFGCKERKIEDEIFVIHLTVDYLIGHIDMKQTRCYMNRFLFDHDGN